MRQKEGTYSLQECRRTGGVQWGTGVQQAYSRHTVEVQETEGWVVLGEAMWKRTEGRWGSQGVVSEAESWNPRDTEKQKIAYLQYYDLIIK